MNVWNFTGHLGQDCKLASTQGGTKVCEFSVAVSSGYGDNEKTTWANCVMFGKRAEGKLPECLVKGQKVAISGQMQLETWETETSKGSKVKVLVNSIDLIGAKAQSNQPRQQTPQQQQQQAPTPSVPDAGNFDDDIPF